MLGGPRRRLRVCWRGNTLGAGAPSDGEKLPCQKSLVASGATNKTCTNSEYSIGSCPGKGDGIQPEADPRHQEILIRELEQDVRGLSTWSEEPAEERWAEAQTDRVALDRPGLAFATKELCRRMWAPTKADTGAPRRGLYR